MNSNAPVNRRDFLGQVAVAGSAAVLASGPLASGPLAHGRDVAADKPGSRMRFGLVTYLWGQDWNLPTLIANLEKSRVFGVELRSTHAHGVEPSLDAQQRREVRQRFEDSPVVCCGPGSNERYDNPDPAVVKKAIEATKSFVVLSHDIGATGVKVKPDRFYDEVPREKTIEQIGRSLNQLGKFAEDYGQQIRLEIHGGCAHLTDIKAIMDVADHPSVAVCWNSNDQDLAGKGLSHNFHLVRDRFGATCHVRQLHLGNYPYQELFDMMVKTDYDGWVLLEARGDPEDRVAALIEQRKHFEQLVAEAQKKI